MIYEELHEILKDGILALDVKYARLYAAFIRLMEEQTAHTGISFSGTFPRMTYVCKDHGFSDVELCRLNRFRLHCLGVMRRHDVPGFPAFLYDVKSLASAAALIYGEEIPPALLSMLPEDDAPVDFRPLHKGANGRMVVDSWDGQYIYGYMEDEDAAKVRADYHARAVDEDLCYIPKILVKGSQLYLLDVETTGDGVLLPRQIIFEPDYMVDISSVAACWKEYGHLPYNNLVRKLMPSANTAAIQLGNIAGQFLDEAINNRSGKPLDYASSVRRFFQSSALELLTCDDLGEFHSEARRQLQNIERFVGEVFGGVHHIKPDKLVLEPSFICEELGLQGRVDLLQDDYKVLMEQKSGKRAYGTNSHREEHYIQMLLYRLLLLYNFGIEGNDAEQYLLYSRFPDGLLLESAFNPLLMREVLKLRNQMVKCDFLYAEGKVGAILEKLTPERLNSMQCRDVLWTRYQKPQLAELLDVYKRASSLEKAYFTRFFTFVAKEHVLAKTGNSSHTHGFSSVWRCDAAEKKLLGDILSGMRLSEKLETTEGGGYDIVRFSVPPQGDDFLPNFRAGDVVILYAYTQGTEPRANKAKILRGNIREILPDEVSVQLRFPQRNTCIFPEDKVWAVEHDFIESSYTLLYRGLYAFLSANEERRNLLLDVRKPRRDATRKLNGSYDDGNVPLSPFLLKAKQAEDYFLLVGPPGTGKTSYALVAMVKEALTEEGISILLMAYTNRAVDEICEKMQKHGIPFIRIGTELSCDPRFHESLLGRKVRACANANDIRRLLAGTRVFVGTAAAVSSRLNLFKLKRFELAIIDEASQILEPHLLGILSARHEGLNAVGKFILIGDHKQLPAVVQQPEESSKVTEPALLGIGLTDCRDSLFERLIRLQLKSGSGDFIYQLSRQGRMHPEVASFANHAFYHSSLEPIPVNHQLRALHFPFSENGNGLERLVSGNRLAFIASPGDSGFASSEKANKDEAVRVAALLRAIYELAERNQKGSFLPYRTVGVIVPYRNQIAMIRKELARLGIPELQGISIDTVERYQGSERDSIIYSFTIQHPYQLEFLAASTFEERGMMIDRKLNVALTRAREQMFLIGNPVLLAKNKIFCNMMKNVKRAGVWIDVDTGRFLKGEF